MTKRKCPYCEEEEYPPCTRCSIYIRREMMEQFKEITG